MISDNPVIVRKSATCTAAVQNSGIEIIFAIYGCLSLECFPPNVNVQFAVSIYTKFFSARQETQPIAVSNLCVILKESRFRSTFGKDSLQNSFPEHSGVGLQLHCDLKPVPEFNLDSMATVRKCTRTKMSKSCSR